MRSCEQLYTIIATAKFSIAPVSAELMYDGLIDVIASESSAATLLVGKGVPSKKQRNFLGIFPIRGGVGGGLLNPKTFYKFYKQYLSCSNHVKVPLA